MLNFNWNFRYTNSKSCLPHITISSIYKLNKYRNIQKTLIVISGFLRKKLKTNQEKDKITTEDYFYDYIFLNFFKLLHQNHLSSQIWADNILIMKAISVIRFIRTNVQILRKKKR